MNIKMLAKVFGIVLLVVGILGYVPGLTTDGSLLGIFEVGGLHNVVHLLTGILFLIAAFKTEALSRLFFRIFGVVYAIVAVLGFMSGDVLGLFAVNGADNILHLVIAVVALWAGFGMKSNSGSNMGGMNMPM